MCSHSHGGQDCKDTALTPETGHAFWRPAPTCPNCTQPHQGTHVRTYSIHTRVRARHITLGHAPHTHTRHTTPGTPGARTCREYTLPRSPAHSHRVSHPRVSRPRLFFWKLCSPFPSP